MKSDNNVVVGDADSAATAREAGQNHAGEMSSGMEGSVYHILEMLPGFVWIAGPDGEFEYLSQSILDYTGMTFVELKANWTAALHPDDIAVWMQAVAEALRSDRPLERELRVRRSDGAYRWFHSRTRALRDEQGNVIRWYGITWDIEERKQAEEASRKSERELRLIIDTIPALVSVAKPDGGINYINPRIVDYFGVPAEELYESGWLRLVHPDDADAAMQAWRHAVESGKSHGATYRHRCADGQYRWFQVRHEPLRDNDGNILGWYGLLFDVDNQKQAEEALRETEDNFRRILETIPALVLCITSSGRLHYANQRVVEYTGTKLQDLDWSQLIHPEDRDAATRKRLACVENGVSYENMYRVRRADGQYRWFRIYAEPRRSQDGMVWYGLFFDIDAQKRAEEALRESENSLRQIIETIPALVFRTSPGGEPDYMNQRIVEYIGKSLQEVRESGGWAQLVHPDDRDAMLRKKRSSIDKGEPYENVYRFRRADGQYRWFQVCVEPLRDRDGRVFHWYGLFVDIHDEKRVEEALRKTEHNLRQIIEAIPAFVLRAAPSGGLDYMNQRMVEYTGKTLQDLGEWGSWTQLVHPDDVDAALRKWRSCVKQGVSNENAYRMRRADGQYRWFQVRAEPLRDNDGHILRWYGLLFDIDDRKKAEEMLRTTRARLSRATQIATVAELSATIAHEINQPLSAIVVNAHALSRWLLNEPPELERAQLIAERIIRDGNSAAEVVRSIRSLFKEATPTKEPLDINQVITDVLALECDELRKKGITIKIDLEKHLALTLGDPIQIRQVISNLVQNAVDAMESVNERSKLLSICSRADGTTISVDVCDQGSGLESVEKVFEPFFTTKEKGMGMGLAICRSIIEAHDGDLSAATSTEGTTFSITLPVFPTSGPPEN